MTSPLSSRCRYASLVTCFWAVLFGPALFGAALFGEGPFGLTPLGPTPLAAAPPEDLPGPAELISRVRAEHPRLLLDADRFAELRSKLATDSYLQKCDAAARSAADKLLLAPPAEYEIPDGKRLLATSRKVVDRVYALAMTYRLHGGQQYLDRLFAELKAVAAFRDWNPSHFLDTAEMTHGVAIAYDWLYDDWNEEQRKLIVEALVRHGLNPGRNVYRKKGGWPRTDHNWNQVCNGGLMVGALAVADREPELAGEIMHHALQSLPLAMASYAPDGAWNEGPGYWGYATSYNVLFLAAVESAMRSDFGLSQQPGLATTGLFPVYTTGPSGKGFNFEDAGDGAPHGTCLFWLDRRFDLPVCSWMEVTYGKPSAAAMVWYQRPGKSPTDAELPLDKHWQGVEVVTLRSDWSDPNATFVAVQAGSNRVNHNHLDTGGFVLDALGQRWALDLGGDNYNLPGYFGKQRYDYYRLRAEGHNCIVIDPGNGPDQELQAGGRIVQLESAKDRASVTADITPVYRESAQSVRRTMTLDRGSGVVQLMDRIVLEQPADLWWFWHTAAQVNLVDAGRRAILEQSGRTATIELLEPRGAKFDEGPAEPLPTSPNPAGQAVNRQVRKLTLQLPQTRDATIHVRFTPQGQDR